MAPPRLDSPPGPGAAQRPPPPKRQSGRERAARRASRLGMGLSVLAHVLVFVLLYRIVVVRPSGGAPPLPAHTRVTPPGLEVLNLDIVSGAVSVPAPAPVTRPRARPAVPRPAQPQPTQPGAAAKPAQPGAGGQAGARNGESAVDRLRVHEGDKRLWVPVFMTPPAPTPMEQVRQRVAGELREWNDSIAAEDAARRKALDWTIHGKNGERWGIAPDGIHLGKITLPAPQFGGSEKARERDAEWQLIRDEAERAQIHQTFKDRVKAIRARKDAERAAKKKAEKNGKSGKSGKGGSGGSGGGGAGPTGGP